MPGEPPGGAREDERWEPRRRLKRSMEPPAEAGGAAREREREKERREREAMAHGNPVVRVKEVCLCGELKEGKQKGLKASPG